MTSLVAVITSNCIGRMNPLVNLGELDPDVALALRNINTSAVDGSHGTEKKTRCSINIRSDEAGNTGTDSEDDDNMESLQSMFQDRGDSIASFSNVLAECDVITAKADAMVTALQQRSEVCSEVRSYLFTREQP